MLHIFVHWFPWTFSTDTHFYIRPTEKLRHTILSNFIEGVSTVEIDVLFRYSVLRINFRMYSINCIYFTIMWYVFYCIGNFCLKFGLVWIFGGSLRPVQHVKRNCSLFELTVSMQVFQRVSFKELTSNLIKFTLMNYSWKYYALDLCQLFNWIVLHVLYNAQMKIQTFLEYMKPQCCNHNLQSYFLLQNTYFRIRISCMWYYRLPRWVLL